MKLRQTSIDSHFSINRYHFIMARKRRTTRTTEAASKKAAVAPASSTSSSSPATSVVSMTTDEGSTKATSSKTKASKKPKNPYVKEHPSPVALVTSLIKKDSGDKDGKTGVSDDVPKLDMNKLGFKPTFRPATRDKDSTLKCVVVAPQIKSKDDFSGAIVFRCQPNDPTTGSGSWSEKTFFECVWKKKPWLDDIGIDREVLSWFDNEAEQTNNKGYAIRLLSLF